MADARNELKKYLASITINEAVDLSKIGLALECNDGHITAIVQEGDEENEPIYEIRRAIRDELTCSL